MSSFYEEQVNPTLTIDGKPLVNKRISDAEDAHDIANTIVGEGYDAGDRREQALRNLKESGGYTPDQVENIKFVEGLKAKYPNAFIEKTNAKGEKFYLSKPVPMEQAKAFQASENIDISGRMLFTPDGYVTIKRPDTATNGRFDSMLDMADFTNIHDHLATPNHTILKGALPVITYQDHQGNQMPMPIMDLIGGEWGREHIAENPYLKNQVKNLLNLANQAVENQATAASAKQSATSAESLLKDF